jgi:hypothetical protein
LIDLRSLPDDLGATRLAVCKHGLSAGLAALRIASRACALVSEASLRLSSSLPVSTTFSFAMLVLDFIVQRQLFFFWIKPERIGVYALSLAHSRSMQIKPI